MKTIVYEIVCYTEECIFDLQNRLKNKKEVIYDFI